MKILKKVLLYQIVVLCFFNMYVYGTSKNNIYTLASEKEVQEVTRDAPNYNKKSIIEAGDTNAMNNLGIMYMEGQGVKQDYKTAEKYFRQAADIGDTNAMNNLGIMYMEGQGVKQDYKTAEKYFRQAVEMGNTDAMSHLGMMYMEGQGVKQDYKTAEKYFRQAVEMGNTNAKNNLSIMNKQRHK